MNWIVVWLICIVVIVCFTCFVVRQRSVEPFVTIGEHSDSCWDHVKDNLKWDVSLFSEPEQKVLHSMRRLKTQVYGDNTRAFPDLKNACVIPKEHMPLFNTSADSLGMRPSAFDELPEGLVIDLEKHDQVSFQQFLKEAAKYYDKEYIDAKTDLEKQIIEWQNTKRRKELEIAGLKNEVSANHNAKNALLDSKSKCQKDRKEVDRLSGIYGGLVANNNNLLNQIAYWRGRL